MKSMAQNADFLPYTSKKKHTKYFRNAVVKMLFPLPILWRHLSKNFAQVFRFPTILCSSIVRGYHKLILIFWFARLKTPLHLPVYKWERIAFLIGAVVNKLWIFEKSGCKNVFIFPYTSKKQPWQKISKTFFKPLVKTPSSFRIYMREFFQIIPKTGCENAKIQPLYKWGLLFQFQPEPRWPNMNHTA